MDAIPLTKGFQLACYTGFLRKVGSPVEAGLRRARLPMMFEERLDAWLPYERARRFTADVAFREGIPDLGFAEPVSDPLLVMSAAIRDHVLGAPTLYRSLRILLSLSGRLLTHARAWLESVGDQARFCFVAPLGSDVPGYDIGETRTLRFVERAVATFVGPAFKPTRVLLASCARNLRFDVERAYSGVPVYTDQPYGAIEFPRVLLWTESRPGAARAALSGLPARSDGPPASLSQALETYLEGYLGDGYPHIALAAEIAGHSVRTLQRRLKEEQVTYTEVVDNARCRAAMSRLRDGEASLVRLARELGYSEHSAFTRAFRRWTGTTPIEYRAKRGSVPNPTN